MRAIWYEYGYDICSVGHVFTKALPRALYQGYQGHLSQPGAPHQMGGERMQDGLVNWIFSQMFSPPGHLIFVFLSFHLWQLYEKDLILVVFYAL